MSAKLSFNHSFLQHSFFHISATMAYICLPKKKSTRKIEKDPKSVSYWFRLFHQHGFLLALQCSYFFSQSTSCPMNESPLAKLAKLYLCKKDKKHKKEKVPRKRCQSLDLLVTSALIIARPAPFPRGPVKRQPC